MLYIQLCTKQNKLSKADSKFCFFILENERQNYAAVNKTTREAFDRTPFLSPELARSISVREESCS